MSLQVIINAGSLDGGTVVDLSTGATRNADGSLTYTFAGAVGLLDLQELAGLGPVDIKIERLWIIAASVDAAAFIVYPGGGTQQFMDQAGTVPRDGSQWAVLMSMGVRLGVDQVTPEASVISFHLRPYANDEWFRLQAGHRFCPRTMQSHFNQANPVPPA